MDFSGTSIGFEWISMNSIEIHPGHSQFNRIHIEIYHIPSPFRMPPRLVKLSLLACATGAPHTARTLPWRSVGPPLNFQPGTMELYGIHLVFHGISMESIVEN